MRYEIYICTKEKQATYYKQAIAEYEKRLGRYCKIQYKVIKKEKDWDKIFLQEGGMLLIPGTSVSSEELSIEIGRWEKEGTKAVRFFIFDKNMVEMIYEKYKNTKMISNFSVSDFSMNSYMVATILYEQIYRGYRIRNNHPYHK